MYLFYLLYICKNMIIILCLCSWQLRDLSITRFKLFLLFSIKKLYYLKILYPLQETRHKTICFDRRKSTWGEWKLYSPNACWHDFSIFCLLKIETEVREKIRNNIFCVQNLEQIQRKLLGTKPLFFFGGKEKLRSWTLRGKYFFCNWFFRKRQIKTKEW